MGWQIVSENLPLYCQSQAWPGRRAQPLQERPQALWQPAGDDQVLGQTLTPCLLDTMQLAGRYMLASSGHTRHCQASGESAQYAHLEDDSSQLAFQGGALLVGVRFFEQCTDPEMSPSSALS